MLKILWDNITKRNKKDTASILKENILFQEMSARELQFLKQIVHIRHYRPDEIIFRQGEVGFGMYIIAEGTVDITAQKYPPPKSGDTKIHVARLSSGDFFGELALVEENGRRSATAAAIRDTRLIGFFKPDFFEILNRKPATGVKIALQLCKVLGKRLIETNEYIARLDETSQERGEQ